MGRKKRGQNKSKLNESNNLKKAKKIVYEKPVSLRGMHDILPQDQIYWDKIRSNIKRMAENFGYQRIDTPI